MQLSLIAPVNGGRDKVGSVPCTVLSQGVDQKLMPRMMIILTALLRGTTFWITSGSICIVPWWGIWQIIHIPGVDFEFPKCPLTQYWQMPERTTVKAYKMSKYCSHISSFNFIPHMVCHCRMYILWHCRHP